MSDSSTDNSAPRTRYPLSRGWAKAKLIRELAQMEKTQVTLAEEYGVAQSSISEFAQRNATEISAARADIENQFASAWIADKMARIAEYQAEVEDINAARSNGIHKILDVEMIKAKMTILRAVADELGQIPTKVNVSVTQRVTHIVEGVDLENLR